MKCFYVIQSFDFLLVSFRILICTWTLRNAKNGPKTLKTSTFRNFWPPFWIGLSYQFKDFGIYLVFWNPVNDLSQRDSFIITSPRKFRKSPKLEKLSAFWPPFWIGSSERPPVWGVLSIFLRPFKRCITRCTLLFEIFELEPLNHPKFWGEGPPFFFMVTWSCST